MSSNDTDLPIAAVTVDRNVQSHHQLTVNTTLITIPEQQQQKQYQQQQHQRKRRRLQVAYSQRWKDRVQDEVTVPYAIAVTFTNTQKDTIERAVRDLSDRSNVVRFVRRTNQPAYISVRNNAGGCFSRVGRDGSGTIQIVNLNAASGCVVRGTIQHEFMHALGLWNEQTRTDRNRYVAVNLDNVDEKLRHKFDITTESDDLGTPYDYGSIMHDNSTYLSLDPTVPVLTPVTNTTDGVIIGQRDGLSDTDIIELRLLYQCISGPRTFSEYNSNLCTSDCKCWEGAEGCNGNDSNCRGNLKCKNNVCVPKDCTDAPRDWVDSDGDSCLEYELSDDWCEKYGNNFTSNGKTANQACCVCGGGTKINPAYGGCTDVPSDWIDADGDGCVDYESSDDWCEKYGKNFTSNGKTANQACCVCGGGSNSGPAYTEFKNIASPNLCIDLKGSSTRDGTAIVHDECNGGTNQQWSWDANNYIRSSLDNNKCLVGTRGLSDRGTDLVINTCFANDTRFQWVYYPDFSIRPLNNNSQCVSPSLTETLDGVAVMHLFDCDNSTRQQWSRYQNQPLRRNRNIQSASCTDDPLGWYNSFGDNCEWYAEDKNCEDYGSGLMNFGKTANQACCVCGGGSTIDVNDTTTSAPPLDNRNNCWNTIDGWVDSVGDSCFWYGQGDNCNYYGDAYADGSGRTAKDVCCECGGGMPTKPTGTNTTAVPGCSDNPSRWVDANNDGCDFYAIGDNCKKFGNRFANYGKTANEVCCVCKQSASAPCGLFGFRIFCPFTLCGIFGRLLGLCKPTRK